MYHPNNEHKELTLKINDYRIYNEKNSDVTIDAYKEFNVFANEVTIKLVMIIKRWQMILKNF